jgi:hypothetical protein
MDTRRILISVSVLGVAATLIAIVEGSWLFGLSLYGISVVGLGLMLWQAIRQHRRQLDQSRHIERTGAASDASPSSVMSPHS